VNLRWEGFVKQAGVKEWESCGRDECYIRGQIHRKKRGSGTER